MFFWKPEEIARKKSRAGLWLTVAALVASCSCPVAASALKNAEKAKNEAQQNLNEINQEIEDIHAAQNRLQAEMDGYDRQLVSLLTDMQILEGDIATQEEEIRQADADLVQAKEDEHRQYEAMKLRIQYMYENSGKSMLEAVIGAESITDFLNRAEYVSDVYKYDRQMLTDYQATVQQVKDLTVQLANEMEEMEELKQSYTEQQASLQQIIDKKSREMTGFAAKLKNAESLASEYAKTILRQNQIIERERAAAEERRKKQEEEKKKKEEEQRKKQEQANKNNAAGTGSTGTGTGTTGTGTGTAGTGTGTGAGTGAGTGSAGGTGLTDAGLDPPNRTGVSGSDVVSYASQFLGCPYVLGGNSLTEGTDCSYFTMAVFQKFGISLPRSSYEQQGVGQAVSYENARPGDLICYPGHVALYIGDGRIIHASTPRTGVCYGNATYRTITTVRRVL